MSQSFTQAMMAENAELKKQLKFEQEQGTIVVHQNQALLAENSEVKKEIENLKMYWEEEEEIEEQFAKTTFK